MRIAVVGGGPGRAVLLDPDAQGRAGLRDRRSTSATGRGDAFGFGVVFSDETLTVFEHADPESYAAITERFARWTDIDIRHAGRDDAVRRARVLRAGPPRAARDPAGAGAGARRRRAFLVRGAAAGRARRGPTWSSAPTARRARSARALRAGVRPGARAAPVPVHVDGHRPRVRRVQVLHRGDTATASSRRTRIRMTRG